MDKKRQISPFVLIIGRYVDAAVCDNVLCKDIAQCIVLKYVSGMALPYKSVLDEKGEQWEPTTYTLKNQVQ